MIGQLVFPRSGREVTVTLSDGLRWDCDDSEELERIREAFPLKAEPDLPPQWVGRHALFQAAERLGASVSLAKLPRREPVAPA